MFDRKAMDALVGGYRARIEPTPRSRMAHKCDFCNACDNATEEHCEDCSEA